MAPDADITEHHSLAEAAARVPTGVVCLLSALVFHGLSDEAPFEVWMAYQRGGARPRISELPVRLVVVSPAQFGWGVEKHVIEGVTVSITSPARTVADCFKHRNRIGLDVALAALRDYRRLRAGTLAELHDAAEVCRVANVMRPYLAAIQTLL